MLAWVAGGAQRRHKVSRDAMLRSRDRQLQCFREITDEAIGERRENEVGFV